MTQVIVAKTQFGPDREFPVVTYFATIYQRSDDHKDIPYPKVVTMIHDTCDDRLDMYVRIAVRQRGLVRVKRLNLNPIDLECI